MGKFLDLTGQKFNRLTVISLSHKDKWGAYYWNCICECGSEVVMRSNHIKSGHNKSCGCIHSDSMKNKRIDLSGQKFSRLEVIEFYNSTGEETFWKCKCQCGKTVIVKSNSLRRGHTKSCGCYSRDIAKQNIGDKHWNWKGGNNNGYPVEWTYELRERIRNRDNRICKYPNCTHTDIGKKENLSVHHIDGDKKNCNDWNLISLCRKHHMEVEMNNFKRWLAYFYLQTGKIVAGAA